MTWARESTRTLRWRLFCVSAVKEHRVMNASDIIQPSNGRAYCKMPRTKTEICCYSKAFGGVCSVYQTSKGSGKSEHKKHVMAYNHRIEGEGQRRTPLLKAFVVVHVLRVRCNDACSVFQTVVKSAQDNQENIKPPPYEGAPCGIHVDMILTRDR